MFKFKVLTIILTLNLSACSTLKSEQRATKWQETHISIELTKKNLFSGWCHLNS